MKKYIYLKITNIKGQVTVVWLSVSLFLLIERNDFLKNFFKYKFDLAIGIMFAVLCLYSLLTKDYKEFMTYFIISSCNFEIYMLKKELNPDLKNSMSRMAKRTQKAGKKLAGSVLGQVE